MLARRLSVRSGPDSCPGASGSGGADVAQPCEYDRRQHLSRRHTCAGASRSMTDFVDDVLQTIHITALDVIAKLIEDPEDVAPITGGWDT